MKQFASAGHLAAIAATFALAAYLLAVQRSRARKAPAPSQEGRLDLFTLGFAAILIINQTLFSIYGLSRGSWAITTALPLNLCDVAAYIAGAALVTRNVYLVEITYFWALAGTLQGLLQPDGVLPFGSYTYLEYYVDHGGVVIAAIFLVWGLGIKPKRGAVARAFMATLVLGIIVGLVDGALNANYMNLRNKPPVGTTALDWFSPWPWYIFECMALALLLFVVLDLPFRSERRSSDSKVSLAGEPVTRNSRHVVSPVRSDVLGRFEGRR